MSYFVKYKDVIYIHCFGPNDEYAALNKGRYSSNGLKMNSKVFRFNLGTDLYNLKLSKNAKFQLLFLTVPGYYDTTTYSDFNILRLRTSTECKIWDSYKKSFGYPIIYKQSTAHDPENYVPNIDSYININPNFLIQVMLNLNWNIQMKDHKILILQIQKIMHFIFILK